jgi:hypothetical protein
MGSGEKMSIFSNFCPEISFDSFGYFATFLSRYADELDTDMAHERLGRQHADVNDWRWQWSRIIPMHYSACPLYSVLTKPQAISKPRLSPLLSGVVGARQIGVLVCKCATPSARYGGLGGWRMGSFAAL